MFIEFPSHEFQFQYDSSISVEDLRAWLEDNSVINRSSNLTPFLQNSWNPGVVVVIRYAYSHGVHIKILKHRFNICPYTPLLNIVAKEPTTSNVALFNSIMDSILKEIGYYRKGKKDLVLKSIIEEVEESTDIELLNLVNLAHLPNFSPLLWTVTVCNNHNQAEFVHTLMFYKAIYFLALKTLFYIKGVDTNNGRDSEHPGFYTLANMYNNYDYIEKLSVYNILNNSPKTTLKILKTKLKPYATLNLDSPDPLIFSI